MFKYFRKITFKLDLVWNSRRFYLICFQNRTNYNPNKEMIYYLFLDYATICSSTVWNWVGTSMRVFGLWMHPCACSTLVKWSWPRTVIFLVPLHALATVLVIQICHFRRKVKIFWSSAHTIEIGSIST